MSPEKEMKIKEMQEALWSYNKPMIEDDDFIYFNEQLTLEV